MSMNSNEHFIIIMGNCQFEQRYYFDSSYEFHLYRVSYEMVKSIHDVPPPLLDSPDPNSLEIIADMFLSHPMVGVRLSPIL